LAIQRGTLGRVPQPRGERAKGVRLCVVLAQILGDKLGQRRHRTAPNRGHVTVAERPDRLELQVEPLTGLSKVK
jgi:hypothetical protein